LAEMSNGQSSEEDFRSLLRKYILEHNTITIDMRPPELVCTSSSSDIVPIMFSVTPWGGRVSPESI